MINFLKKPYPFTFNSYSVLVPASITFILIIFLAPLGFSSVDFYERVLIAFVISIIVGCSIYIGVSSLKKVFPKVINEDSWTIGKEFLLFVLILFIIILSISIVFITVVIYQNDNINPTEIFFHVLLKTTKITFGICIVPIVVSILIEQKNHQKKQYLKATEISLKLKQEIASIKKSNSSRDKNILFKSENNDIELQVKTSDIKFIKSEGNYIEVHYQNESGTSKKLIRNRIKNIESDLPSSIFFRCHNRYIVNKNFVNNVNGNARGLMLELYNSDEIINVSRSKIKAFESFLNN